jgi:acetylornithine deacetylase/succinyl-diaminopimelate desuccinylase-like protein
MSAHAVCQLTSELIRIPSESSTPTGTDASAPERAVAGRLLDFVTAHGMEGGLREVQPGRWNLEARLPRPGAPRVLLAGHLDTVSALGMADPFTGAISGGDLLGRGACDDKGPLAAACVALASLVGERRALAYDITLLGTADEEAGMAGAKAWSAGGADQDLIIALEPTKLRPVVAHKGAYRCALHTSGRACHSSQPERGSNAITGMLGALAAVQALGAELTAMRDAGLGAPTMTLTGISGGTAINLVPDSCRAQFDIRLIPDSDPAWVAARLRELAGPGVVVEDIFAAPALRRTTPRHGLDQRLARALARHGVDGGETVAPWCSDASFLQARGPCLVWGPGRIEDAHTRDERIAVGELERAVDVLRTFLTDY